MPETSTVGGEGGGDQRVRSDNNHPGPLTHGAAKFLPQKERYGGGREGASCKYIDLDIEDIQITACGLYES